MRPSLLPPRMRHLVAALAVATGAPALAGGAPSRWQRTLAVTARLLASVLLVALAGPAVSAEWRADPAASRLVVHAFRSGLLRAFAHDHHFVPDRWSASASFDPQRLGEVRGEVIVDAASLADTQERLSAEDRAAVDRQVRGEVLDAARFPEIRYEVAGLDPATAASPIAGTLRGTLTLHGVTRPLAFPVEVTTRGEGVVTVRGRASLSLRDFGIRPPRAALGTVSVGDRLEIELEIALRPS